MFIHVHNSAAISNNKNGKRQDKTVILYEPSDTKGKRFYYINFLIYSVQSQDSGCLCGGKVTERNKGLRGFGDAGKVTQLDGDIDDPVISPCKNALSCMYVYKLHIFLFVCCVTMVCLNQKVF